MTCSCRAISGIAISFPLNEKDDVRAVTCSCGTFASRFSSSSERPSEKYSCSLSGLRFVNGRTAIDGPGAAGGTSVTGVVGRRL